MSPRPYEKNDYDYWVGLSYCFADEMHREYVKKIYDALCTRIPKKNLFYAEEQPDNLNYRPELIEAFESKILLYFFLYSTKTKEAHAQIFNELSVAERLIAQGEGDRVILVLTDGAEKPFEGKYLQLGFEPEHPFTTTQRIVSQFNLISRSSIPEPHPSPLAVSKYIGNARQIYERPIGACVKEIYAPHGCQMRNTVHAFALSISMTEKTIIWNRLRKCISSIQKCAYKSNTDNVNMTIISLSGYYSKLRNILDVGRLLDKHEIMDVINEFVPSVGFEPIKEFVSVLAEISEQAGTATLQSDIIRFSQKVSSLGSSIHQILGSAIRFNQNHFDAASPYPDDLIKYIKTADPLFSGSLS